MFYVTSKRSLAAGSAISSEGKNGESGRAIGASGGVSGRRRRGVMALTRGRGSVGPRGCEGRRFVSRLDQFRATRVCSVSSPSRFSGRATVPRVRLLLRNPESVHKMHMAITSPHHCSPPSPSPVFHFIQPRPAFHVVKSQTYRTYIYPCTAPSLLSIPNTGSIQPARHVSRRYRLLLLPRPQRSPFVDMPVLSCLFPHIPRRPRLSLTQSQETE